MALSTQERILVEQRITNEGPSVAVAYLFWFFLGIVSAHRFYLGRPVTALLQIASYLIVVGVVWWFIDVFLIPVMIRERQEALRARYALELGGSGQ